MEISRFTEKLNRVEGNVYRIEERAVLQGGTYEGELAHDNVDPETLSVYTGPKLTGEKVDSYSLSVPAMAPWKHIIRVYADAPEVYISYSTEGDMVEADDVNRLQDAVVAAQEAVNAEAAVREGLALEVERAAEADQALRDALAAEVKRAMDAEALLAGNTGGSGEGGSISFIEQTTVSTEDGGVNVWTMQLSDGTRRDFEVRNGTRGRDGVDGMDGAPGKDGVDGRDGAPGPAGNDGAPGRNGTDGAPGPAGSDGFSPTITVNSGNSSEVYKLDITTKNGKITTPNLKGADGKDSTRTEEILEMFGGLKFGQDKEGNWGYIPIGADAVIPFKSMPDGLREIRLLADPQGYGTVSGGGMAADGMTVTVHAKANEDGNYLFDGWKEGGATVSTDEQYGFLVSADRSLIAAFVELQYVAGVDWWESLLPSSTDWYSVTFGNGKFVAVTLSDKAAYSTDGINWTAANLPTTANWRSVTYGDGKFVAVAYNSNKAAYSTDGINWTAANLPTTATWRSVTYGDGKFIAVADKNNRVAYSTDGITWQLKYFPINITWYSVTYGGEKFVAVAYDSNKAVYSTDGINWTTANLPSIENWYSVTYGDGKFVAVAYNSNKAAYSTDGINWTAANLPTSAYWSSVTYGDGKFVAVAYNSNKAAYSTDGINWTAANLPTSAYWNSVTCGNGKFVAVARGTNKMAYSSAKGPDK